MASPGGYVAYDAEGNPVGMGPTKESAIAEARQRGCTSGRLRAATTDRVKEAYKGLPPRARGEAPQSAVVPCQPSPGAQAFCPPSDYFEAMRRGDFAAGQQILAQPPVGTPGA